MMMKVVYLCKYNRKIACNWKKNVIIAVSELGCQQIESII